MVACPEFNSASLRQTTSIYLEFFSARKVYPETWLCDPLAKSGLHRGPRCSASLWRAEGCHLCSGGLFSFCSSRSDCPSPPMLHLGLKDRAGVFFLGKGPWAAMGLPLAACPCCPLGGSGTGQIPVGLVTTLAGLREDGETAAGHSVTPKECRLGRKRSPGGPAEAK